jgi:putative ABC transport system permease protein
MPQKDITVNFYKMDLVSQYDSSRLFRNSVMIVGIITLIIALIGLIGYINDEVNRRRAEISIRKVNGATIYNVQQLFLADILKIAIPALLLGSITSAISANKWMEDFSEKASLSPLLFIACAITVLAVILTVVLIDTYKVAIQNPSKTII